MLFEHDYSKNSGPRFKFIDFISKPGMEVRYEFQANPARLCYFIIFWLLFSKSFVRFDKVACIKRVSNV